jgi:outer membrane lipoprotein-sorting protein
LQKTFLPRPGRLWGCAALALLALVSTGCLGPVRRTTVVASSQAPAPALDATLPDLLTRLNNQSEKIQTLSATVDFQPTAGSVYSGVIKEYHDVKGFILLKKPAMIRILGQAPVVRTNIFDMVSDGREFRLSIPPKQKFIVGKTEFRRPSKNALENLRPQHILDALVIPPLDRAASQVSFEEDEADGRRYYVLTALQPVGIDEFSPLRKIWFDRSDLNIARLQIYSTGGTYIEDVHYSGYQDFEGVSYPTKIRLQRPVEDYALEIDVEKAVFNQPIPEEKFELKKPANAQLVELSDAAGPGGSHGK